MEERDITKINPTEINRKLLLLQVQGKLHDSRTIPMGNPGQLGSRKKVVPTDGVLRKGIVAFKLYLSLVRAGGPDLRHQQCEPLKSGR